MGLIELVYLIDFDNVLFANPDHNYSDVYLTLDKVTDKKDLPFTFLHENKNILVTGRGKFQEKQIREILGNKHYTFDKLIFFGKSRKSKPDHNNKITLISYYKKYWDFKVKIIRKFRRKYRSIQVIDDDRAVIDYCQKKKVPYIYFNILKKEVS